MTARMHRADTLSNKTATKYIRYLRIGKLRRSIRGKPTRNGLPLRPIQVEFGILYRKMF